MQARTRLLLAVCVIGFAASNLCAASVLSGEENDVEVRRKSYMSTRFNLKDDGQLTAITKVWSSRKRLFGFTGGVRILLLDKDKYAVFESEQHTYFVKGGFRKRSREEQWQEQVPKDVLPKVKFYKIVQQHAPTGRVWSWIKNNKGPILDVVKKIIFKP